MKRILSGILVLAVMLISLAGCGGNAKRELYNVKLSKYVKLGDYKNIAVDKSTDEFKEFYNNVISEDVSANGFYVKKTEGKVANGDTVNIDYCGKKDGVAFDGGTASGQELEIGSNSFIEGFEEGLIDVQIGSTVDLNLTFPENYSNSAELAGQAVVFTVTVNYVITDEERKPEDFYSELSFNSFDEYKADVEKRAVKDYLFDTVKNNSEIKDYPKDDTENIYSNYRKRTESGVKSQTGMELTAYLEAIGQTEDAFKDNLVENQIKPEMELQMLLYAILDKENIEVTEKDVDAAVEEMLDYYKGQNISKETVLEFYGDFYFEYIAVSDKVLDFLYDNAKIS